MQENAKDGQMKKIITVAGYFALISGSLEVSAGNAPTFAIENSNTQTLACRDDLLIYSNGKHVCGQLMDLPPLHYSFDNLNFEIAEIAGIAILHNLEQTKVQYITHRGETYIGTLPQELLHFTERNGGLKDIDINELNFVIIGKRRETTAIIPQKFHALQLKNGDSFPVTFEKEDITVSNGQEDYLVSLPEIGRADVNGGLQGDIIGRKDPLEFAFIKDKHIEVTIPSYALSVKLPWEQIACILCPARQTVPNLPIIPLAYSGVSSQVQIGKPAAKPNPIPGYDYVSLDALALNDLSGEEEEVDKKEEEIIQEEGDTRLMMEEAQKNPETEHTPNFKIEEHRDMVYIPAGRYNLSIKAMGSKHYLVPTENNPLFAVDLQAFYIDKHEVTNKEYQAFVRASSHSAPEHWQGGVIPKGLEDQPVVNVTYKDAEAYAKWVGKRMPTEIEWEAAANHALEGEAGIKNMQIGNSEWTSSPISMTQGVPNNQRYAYVPIQRNLYRIVRQKLVSGIETKRVGLTGNATRLTQHQEDSNNQTSFRCVADISR